MQDLHVDKILPETLPLSEAFIQIYELQSNKNKSSWDFSIIFEYQYEWNIS